MCSAEVLSSEIPGPSSYSSPISGLCAVGCTKSKASDLSHVPPTHSSAELRAFKPVFLLYCF